MVSTLASRLDGTKEVIMLRLLRWTVSIVIPCLVLAGPAAARTITVHPGESIRAALAQASPGDRVQVLPGTYAKDRPAI